MTTTPDVTRRFSADMLAGLDEPVRRYFSHAISDGAALPSGVRMAMSGRIKVGIWLPFTAEQTVNGRSFTWRARVGRGPLGPEPHMLDGRWTVTAEREHLLPGQGHLHGATGQFVCRHRREDGLRVNLEL